MHVEAARFSLSLTIEREREKKESEREIFLCLPCRQKRDLVPKKIHQKTSLDEVDVVYYWVILNMFK